MPSSKHILVYAEHPAIRRTKQLMLEGAGFNVIAVGSIREVEYVTSRSMFDLVILGRTVPPANKSVALQIVKAKIPAARILEICEFEPCVENPDYILKSSDPEELMEMVKSIFPKR
jgi:DNA-binding NtrC family response regulator